jgi:hypothetical protein
MLSSQAEQSLLIYKMHENCLIRYLPENETSGKGKCCDMFGEPNDPVPTQNSGDNYMLSTTSVPVAWIS